MIKFKSVKPLFNKIVTTCNIYDEDRKENGIIVATKGTVKEYQVVESVGSMVRDIKPGDIVMINFTRYTVPKHKDKTLADDIKGDEVVANVKLPLIKYNDTNHLLLNDSDIDYIINGIEDKKTIITPPKVSILS